VRIGVGFRATDARTGEVVSGGDGGRIECATVPFREMPASQVFAGSLPLGVVADDLLSGTFTLSATVDAATATQARGDWGRRAQTADAPFPFSAALRSYLDNRSGETSVAVYGAAGGATYTLDPQGRFVTASIVKMAILGTLLRQAQDNARGLSGWEQDTATRMIEYSDNDAATALWNEVGRGAGVAAFMALVGMPDTVPGDGGYWGLTRTSAADQVQLMRRVAFPNPVLGDAARGYLAGLMSNVTPSQRWGVSAGVPREVPVAVKNGWLPVANGWEINSIGHVSGGLHDYVVAVLSVGSPSMNDGISTVEGVSSLVWSDLAAVSVGDEHYAALGGAEGFMGQPTGPELGTPDGVGRYRGYQGGAIYWSPASGAHEVHGEIAAHWLALGGVSGLLGYPVTDELGTPDRLGRFSHFTTGSIYWTVATGAHEVHGAIQVQWAALGWENGPLGYPVSDEHDVTGGRAGSFQAARSLRRRRPAPTLSTATSIGGTDRSAARTHCLVCQ
jgi:beta-lactamase class A